MLGNYGAASQLVASRVALSSVELVNSRGPARSNPLSAGHSHASFRASKMYSYAPLRHARLPLVAWLQSCMKSLADTLSSTLTRSSCSCCGGLGTWFEAAPGHGLFLPRFLVVFHSTSMKIVPRLSYYRFLSNLLQPHVPQRRCVYREAYLKA
jgi:hypothetical protein